MSNGVLAWLLMTVAILWTFNCVWYVSKIGKERKPINATYAGWDLLVNGGMIAVIVIAAVRLVRP